MNAITRLTTTVIVCALASIVGTGCNTVRGAGKDIQKGGKAVENAAENIHAPREVGHMIMASADTGGRISPVGNLVVENGKSRTYTIKADTGYHVADVLVDGKSQGAVSRHTFSKPTGDHTISALFTADPKE
tara:strand:+ start:803 stop:1198 length:396 start_codon:yes stop_codon:yes gene_type:complete